MIAAMTKLGTLQLLGPIAFFAAVAGAECAAYGLTQVPSSEWLWYLNLKWFGMFQQSHYTINEFLGFGCEQLLFVAMPIFATACIGFAFRRTLLLAVASNLSFVYIGFVLYCWGRAATRSEQASLSVQYVDVSNPELIVLTLLAGLSFFSFIISHISYIQRARAGA